MPVRTSGGNLPFTDTDTPADVTELIVQHISAEDYPNPVEMAAEYILQPGCDFGYEFEFGLGVVLNALESRVIDS